MNTLSWDVPERDTPLGDFLKFDGCRLPAGGPIGVAVSGGGDSVALLLLMVDWAAAAGREIAAVTVDHGLRQEATAEAELVTALSEGLGVEHSVLRWNGAAHHGNVQDGARQARLRLIGDWARERGIGAVVTGHTRDDQAETFLMRLARGSGVDGLAAMARSVARDGVVWARPLLDVRRDALRDFLQERGVSWAEDPSNEDVRFERVKMRRALGNLADLGLTVERLAQTADRMGTARNALEQMTLELARSVAMPREIGSVDLDLNGFFEAPVEVQERLMAHILGWISGADYRPRVTALRAAIAAMGRGQVRTLSGCLIAPVGKGRAEICREVAAFVPSPAGVPLIDRRWEVVAADRPTKGIWQAFGEDGLKQRPDWREFAHSKNALMGSPSLWYNNELQSAPFADKNGPWTCRLVGGVDSFFATLATH